MKPVVEAKVALFGGAGHANISFPAEVDTWSQTALSGFEIVEMPIEELLFAAALGGTVISDGFDP